VPECRLHDSPVKQRCSRTCITTRCLPLFLTRGFTICCDRSHPFLVNQREKGAAADVIGSDSVSLQFLGETESNNRRELHTFISKGSAASEASMNTLILLKRNGEVHFHLHPLLETFSLIASFLLAVLVVLMLVLSAR